jgi:two-component system, NarL family, sensor kinase
LLAALRPRYAGGWLMFATGVAFLVGQVADQVAETAAPAPALTAAWVSTWIYSPALVPLFVLVPLTFPDGRLPSRRWRPLVAAAVALIVALALAGAFLQPEMRIWDRVEPNPYAVSLPAGWPDVTGLLGLVTLAASVFATASLVVRWRSATVIVRRQILLVSLALGVTMLAFATDAAVAHLAPDVYPAVFPVVQLTPIVVPIAVAVAVLRHHLFDIDVLVSRTVVYVLLTLTLVAVYAATVASAGAALPGVGDGLGRVLAVAVVAVGFAPVREVLQRRVGRRILGDRNEPYAALARLSREVGSEGGPAAAPEDVLNGLVLAVAESMRSPYVSLALRAGGVLEAPGEHGKRPADDAQLVTVDLSHAGQPVGRLVVARRPWERLSAADRQLLDLLALPVAAALHALRLTREVQQSREQLVRRVEEERRRLGRDLHDGLGPRLAAIGMQVEAAADVVRVDPERAAALLTTVLDQTDLALAETRSIAHAHRPPTLAALGLVPALEAHVGHLAGVSARLEVTERLPMLPAAVETAAYRIATEAVLNVARHSGASRCVVRLARAGDRLHVDIEDDGHGMNGTRSIGIGLQSMRERAEELGGTLTVTRGAGGLGTRVTAVLPCLASWPDDDGVAEGQAGGPRR